MEEGGLFFSVSCGQSSAYLQEMAAQEPLWKQASQQTQSEVLAIFSWETSGPAIRMDLALSSATYLNFFLHIPSC